MLNRRIVKIGLVWIGLIVIPPALLAILTLSQLAPSLPDSLDAAGKEGAVPTFLDRNGLPLNRTYRSSLNPHEVVAFHDIPERLGAAFIFAEDRRFFQHRGIDWLARAHALYQNLSTWQNVRGASTISEQVVRILYPRPRTYWSRWLEGWDAMRLERRFGKTDILEFYLNQVPFSSGRRGIIQAARLYFGRSLSTLNTKEMLALAVLVRAPSRLDPFRGQEQLQKRIAALAECMLQHGVLSFPSYTDAISGTLQLQDTDLPVEASHFLGYIKERLKDRELPSKSIRTTLDGELHEKIRELLDQRLKDIAELGIKNGGVLVIDHTTGEVLVWAVAGNVANAENGSAHDAILTPRQPGSTLKPFVYALALDRDWAFDTPIKDEPIVEPVENGLHIFRNFSQIYYGSVTLAEALGNSLNTPAVRTLEYVGLGKFLDLLRNLGVTSLTRGDEAYGNGVVLGNAEISLLELVQAYACLANEGTPLKVSAIYDEADRTTESDHFVISPATASAIGMILSEDRFRQLEFGEKSILSFPERTAVKTGTSTKGNDVWTFAYNGRFLAGIWFGNMNRSSPKKLVTGVAGPALLARSVFHELGKRYGNFPFPRVELPTTALINRHTVPPEPIRMLIPAPDMEFLLDPRIAKSAQFVPFTITGLMEADKVVWNVDNAEIYSDYYNRLLWPVTIGEHSVSARILVADGRVIDLPLRRFVVR